MAGQSRSNGQECRGQDFESGIDSLLVGVIYIAGGVAVASIMSSLKIQLSKDLLLYLLSSVNSRDLSVRSARESFRTWRATQHLENFRGLIP